MELEQLGGEALGSFGRWKALVNELPRRPSVRDGPGTLGIRRVGRSMSLLSATYSIATDEAAIVLANRPCHRFA